MNILFWTDGFWPSIGGAETQGLEFVQAMQARGHCCKVLCQQKNAEERDQEVYNGIEIRRFDFNAILEKRDLKQIGSIREHLRWIQEEFCADLIYLNTLGNGSAFFFLLFRKQLSIPAVATVHSPYFLEGEFPPLMRQLCDVIDQICCVSQWTLNFLQEKLPTQRNKFQMIYCGVSLPNIAPEPLPFSPPVLLLLGRLSSEKGFEIGIEAFSLLRKEGWNARLLIAGEGGERPYLEHLIRQRNLFSCTRFTGKLSRDEVYATINQATLTVMPSQLETFGLVALESMRMGRPVVASHVGGLPEIIAHGERGLLVSSREPYAFCQAIKDLLCQPRLCAEMGQNARKWSSERFLLEENIDAYEKLFQSYCSPCRL